MALDLKVSFIIEFSGHTNLSAAKLEWNKYILTIL